MKTRQRKFIGVLLILASLVIYAVLAVMLFELLIAGLPQAVQLVYFAIAGVGWALPAAWIIRWMQRPDDETEI